MTKTLLRTNGVWDVVAQMGGGWAIGIATAGTDAEILGAGRVEWVAAGAIQVNTTSWDVKASSYLAESGGMVGAMRALTRTSMHFSEDRYVRRPDVLHFCDSDSLVRSLESRLRDSLGTPPHECGGPRSPGLSDGGAWEALNGT